MHRIQINFTLTNWYCERTTTNYLHLTALTLHLPGSPMCQCETHPFLPDKFCSSLEGTDSESLIPAHWKKNVNFLIKTDKVELSHENKIMAWHEFHLKQHKEINREKRKKKPTQTRITDLQTPLWISSTSGLSAKTWVIVWMHICLFRLLIAPHRLHWEQSSS